MKLPIRQARDPWWDLEGHGVRLRRRKRAIFSLAILLTAVALLATVWGVLPVRAAGTGVNLDQWASTVYGATLVVAFLAAIAAALALGLPRAGDRRRRRRS